MADIILSDTYNELLNEVQSLQKTCPLSADNVVLLAVVKQQPDDKIIALLEAGHRYFAENRIEEARCRWPDFRITYPNIELHHIGALQSGKVREAVGLYDVIETLDRHSLLHAVQKEAQRIGKVQRCYVQVNIGEELQKSGVLPQQLESFMIQAHAASHIIVEGLMCIPPEGKAPAPYFALMRNWQRQYKLPALSMGMSGDYATAIRFGATHIRLGTRLLGERS